MNHPLELVARFSAHFDKPLVHEFSKYVYVPQAVSENRTVYQSKSTTLRKDFERHASELQNLEEIAFHSRVVLEDGTELHVPMVDMGCQDFTRHLENLKGVFADFGIKGFSVFSSGRSFHIYGHDLLSGSQIIRFMGRMLLLNLPGKEHVIDERWVGHRLMAGYLTLRWTRNNPHYRTGPTFVAEIVDY